MTKPITPQEAKASMINNIPDFVIEAFNTLIIKNYANNSSIIKQKDIIDLIAEKSLGFTTKEEILERHWLDVEDIYYKAGWHVEYDKPAYFESYDACFKFTLKALS